MEVEYYSERSAEYDRIYQKPERQKDLRILESRVEESFAGKTVLELACGTGHWTAFIERKAKAVDAVDINDSMVAIAKTRTSGKVRYLLDDVMVLSRLEGPHDAGFAGFWLSHVRKSGLGPFFEVFHSKLSPGARVLLIDNLYVEGSSTPISRIDGEGNSYQTRKLDSGKEFEIVKNFYNAKDLATLLPRGITSLETVDLEYFWVCEYTIG